MPKPFFSPPTPAHHKVSVAGCLGYDVLVLTAALLLLSLLFQLLVV
jgi:hypothetical protein